MWMRAFAITGVLLLSTPAMAETITTEQSVRERRAAEFEKLRLEKLKADNETKKLKPQLERLPRRQHPTDDAFAARQITDKDLEDARRAAELATLTMERLKAELETQKLTQ